MCDRVRWSEATDNPVYRQKWFLRNLWTGCCRTQHCVYRQKAARDEIKFLWTLFCNEGQLSVVYVAIKHGPTLTWLNSFLATILLWLPSRLAQVDTFQLGSYLELFAKQKNAKREKSVRSNWRTRFENMNDAAQWTVMKTGHGINFVARLCVINTTAQWWVMKDAFQ